MKAGIFGNHSSQDSFTTTGAATLPASGHDDQAAFVGEIGIKGAARISDHLARRGGYRTLWIDSVATAVEQLGATDFFAGTGLNNSGDVFYHGAFVGFELAY